MRVVWQQVSREGPTQLVDKELGWILIQGMGGGVGSPTACSKESVYPTEGGGTSMQMGIDGP